MRPLLLLLAALAAVPAAAQTVRVGTFEDLEVVDPATSRVFAGLQILSTLCDKLLDLNPDLSVAPALAERHEWAPDGRGLTLHLREGATFHDGAPVDAKAVRFNMNRFMTMPGSFRRGEMPAVRGVTVLGPRTARIDLSEPFVPLISVLVTRGGMMVSPRAASEGRFADNPVCSGPFRLTERVALDRIVLDRVPNHWNAANVHVQRVVFRPMPDANVRVQNLRGGALEMMERVATSDVETLARSPRLRTAGAPELGYSFIRFNVANGAGANGPFARDVRLRAAFDAALDRTAINQVVFDGAFVPGNQWVAPGSPFYAAALPVPARDLPRARALLAEAGQPAPTLRLTVPNAPDALQAAEVMQAMVREAGINLVIQATEIGTASGASLRGDFEAFLNFWGGRSDPDGNASFHLTCNGPNNDGKYCVPEVDAALATPDVAERRRLSAEAAARVLADKPYLNLWHRQIIWGLSDRVTGFVPYPDGVLRRGGVRLRGG